MIATIDFETTGLKAGEDEVLQVSIIDENYNVLLNVYCRPNNKDSWEDAQAVHGITPLMVKQLGRYTEAEVLAAVINGLFTVFIEKESASDDVPFGESIPEEMQVDQEDENSIELAPGAVIDLGEGEKANMVNPGRPNPNFDPFVIAVLKQIGAALEIPYEILIMAFSSNYSASRAAILEFFKVVKMYRAWFVADFCQPIYEEWLSEAVAKGRIKAPGFFTDPIIKDAYCSAEWTGPSAGQLDPTKEVEAAEKRVQGGYSTREREARELTGTDFYKNIKQRKREEELLQAVLYLGAMKQLATRQIQMLRIISIA